MSTQHHLQGKLANLTLSEIQEQWPTLPMDEGLMEELLADPRQGTTRLARQLQRSLTQQETERKNIRAKKEREQDLYLAGYRYIAGVDEVGRGALAGPVVAAAVILPRSSFILGVDDSKRLSAKKRKQLAQDIWAHAVTIGIGQVEASRIDTLGIRLATFRAMEEALRSLEPAAELALIDSSRQIREIPYPHQAVKMGDSRCYCIAAASIVAKVYRDSVMAKYHRLYPAYNFLENKGYGTQEHLQAVERYGYSSLHRTSFRFHELDQLSLFP